MQTFNIVIGGEAGQGLVTVGELLCKALAAEAYPISVTQSYQSRIRGGHNTFSVRIGPETNMGPEEKFDILVALDAETIDIHKAQAKNNAVILAREGEGLIVPYDKFGGARSENIAALGVVCALLGLKKDTVLATIENRFSKKGEGVSKENEDVLEKAYAWAAAQKISVSPVPKERLDKRPLLLNGNEAIALGAISAGLKFYSFYPMTPATSVSLAVIKHAKEAGVVFEQAEDEISAINMAIGASFAGAVSMVATSGGGFALMVEGVSLAGMTETPLVIVVAQRPGPATGLPTRTEQADLEFVLYCGHGEFPRAIFAPSTIEECFYLTRKAFELAEKYQTPVFILTDQYLADSIRSVPQFDVAKLIPVTVGASEKDIIVPYERFALTKNGISPRLIPGKMAHLVVAGSDEHTADGHLTEDLDVRVKMVEKRLAKMKGMMSEAVPPSYFGDKDADILLVCFGSTEAPAREAVRQMMESGKKAAVLNFSQVWPMVPEQFLGYLRSAKKVVSVEGNATSQLAGLIKKTTAFDIKEHINRYDGLPITAEEIWKKIFTTGK